MACISAGRTTFIRLYYQVTVWMRSKFAWKGALAGTQEDVSFAPNPDFIFGLLHSGMPRPLSVGAAVNYTLSQERGAMVWLKPPGRHIFIDTQLRIKNYMKSNVESWLEHANCVWEAGKKEDDLMFVSGVVTTTEWVVAAIQRPIFKSKGESADVGDITTDSNGRVSVTLSGKALPSSHSRYGPTDCQGNLITVTSDLVQDPCALEGNQCLFIHYYKMKRRWGLFPMEPMRAGAGYDQLPPPETPGSEGPAVASYDIGSNEPEEVSVPEGAMVSLTK